MSLIGLPVLAAETRHLRQPKNTLAKHTQLRWLVHALLAYLRYLGTCSVRLDYLLTRQLVYL